MGSAVYPLCGKSVPSTVTLLVLRGVTSAVPGHTAHSLHLPYMPAPDPALGSHPYPHLANNEVNDIAC